MVSVEGLIYVCDKQYYTIAYRLTRVAIKWLFVTDICYEQMSSDCVHGKTICRDANSSQFYLPPSRP